MFSSSINLDQARTILHGFKDLVHVESTPSDLYLASHTVAVVPSSTRSSMQKVSDYLSTWSGWTQDLSYLPTLTNKVKIFVQNAFEGRQNIDLKENEIQEAIQGLGILWNSRGNKTREFDFIEQAIQDLLSVMQQIEKNKGDDITQEPSKEKGILPKETSPSDNWWISMSSITSMMYGVPAQLYSSLSNASAQPTSLSSEVKEEECKEDEDQWVLIDSPSASITEFSPDVSYKELVNRLGHFLHSREEDNTPALHKQLRMLLVDPTLLETKAYKLEDSEETLSIPSQFYVDCSRFNSLTVNNKLLHSLHGEKLSREKISQLLIKEMGQKVFERIGALVHQSLVAQQVVDWSLNNWPEEWIGRLYIAQAKGFDFTIRTLEDSIEIDASIPLAIKNSQDQDEHMHPKSIGYFMLQRRLSLPKKELEESLEELEPACQVPHAKVTQRLSDLYPTLEEALNSSN
ncbi:hypothetical protein [Candidatus Protochlamydia phocaeensis]|uniref:hypothetical protein n=1 Tax=Candidatus Protochlamydia phocaeensis TaxID=1414722 RepID=UPI0012AB3C8F|nr:hypothetical protein [Candidatus Protochlamydia phocaeensis]